MNEEYLPQTYDVFRQTVEDIRSGAIKARYLGGGSESQVFETLVNGRAYAVKFANKYTLLDRPRNTVKATQRKIDAGLRGLGVAGLEQIQSASPENGVSIFGLVEGVTVKSMDDKMLQEVTKPQLQAFYDSIDKAVEAGIEFDPWNQDGSNVLYSPQKGFTLIDYFVEYAETSSEESRLDGIKALGTAALKLDEVYKPEI